MSRVSCRVSRDRWIDTDTAGTGNAVKSNSGNTESADYTDHTDDQKSLLLICVISVIRPLRVLAVAVAVLMEALLETRCCGATPGGGVNRLNPIDRLSMSPNSDSVGSPRDQASSSNCGQ